MSNSIQSSLRFNLENKAIAINTTSLSTALIFILQIPCLGISCTCKKTRVVASSCVQGTMKLQLHGWLQITVSSKAHIINSFSSKILLAMAFEGKRNDSDLFYLFEERHASTLVVANYFQLFF